MIDDERLGMGALLGGVRRTTFDIGLNALVWLWVEGKDKDYSIRQENRSMGRCTSAKDCALVMIRQELLVSLPAL